MGKETGGKAPGTASTGALGPDSNNFTERPVL